MTMDRLDQAQEGTVHSAVQSEKLIEVWQEYRRDLGGEGRGGKGKKVRFASEKEAMMSEKRTNLYIPASHHRRTGRDDFESCRRE